MTNPRKVKPSPTCPQCHGCGLKVISHKIAMPKLVVCQCVLDQLDDDNEPFIIDTSDLEPNVLVSYEP